MTAPSTTNRAAARTVVMNATDPAEARLLLDILGLVGGPTGREILPDDVSPNVVFGDVGKAPGAPSERGQVEMDRRPENCTTPAGLRELPPLAKTRPAAKKTKPARTRASVIQEPSAVRTGNGRRAAVCGTRSGYQRHLRNGEQTCPACREANTAVQRQRTAALREPGTPSGRQRPACGTVSGYSGHVKRHETTCEACKAAQAAYSRQRYAAKTARPASSREGMTA